MTDGCCMRRVVLDAGGFAEVLLDHEVVLQVL